MGKLSLEIVCWWAIMILYGGILVVALCGMFYGIFTGPSPGEHLGIMFASWIAIAMVALVINKIHE